MIKKNYLALFILIFFLCAHLPTLAVAANSAEKKVSSRVQSEKTFIAAEKLIRAMELDKDIDTAVSNSGAILKKVRKAQNPKNQPRVDKNFAEASSQYEKQKKKITNDVTMKLKTLLSNTFSESEMNYLSQLATYQPLVKYRKLLTSAEFGQLLFEPNKQAVQILQDVEYKEASSTDTKEK